VLGVSAGNGSTDERARARGDRSLRLFSEMMLDLRWPKGSMESPTHICWVSLIKPYPPNEETGEGDDNVSWRC